MSLATLKSVARKLGQHGPAPYSLVEGRPTHAIEKAVESLDKEAALSDIESMKTRLAPYLKYPRFRAVLLAAFSLMALALAAIGLYGLLAQFVAQRTVEVGLRKAVGARGIDIVGLIARITVRTVKRVALRCCLLSVTLVQPAFNAALQHQQLNQTLNQLISGFPGRVGVCVLDKAGASCVRGSQSFSLQSVVKLIVSLAVLDKIDHHQLGLDDRVVVHRQDLSLYVEPIADLVGPKGYRTTIRDLIHRAIVDSDSAASDILSGRIGGTRQVQSFLNRTGIQGIRINRDERHLQTEIVGLTWRPEYVDPEVLRKAIESVPAKKRESAYRRYQADVRDTATPFGMASLLQRLSNGDLLSPTSTQFALETLAQTVTFPDRLKAGVPAAWVCMHKTGTSGSWQGVTAATNDVGILQTPDGEYLAIAVFVADTKEPPETRSRLIRNIAAAAVKEFR